MNNKLKSYNKYINTFKYHFILAFPINIMQLICSFYSMQVIDRVLSTGNFDTLAILTFISIFLTIYGDILMTFRKKIIESLSEFFIFNDEKSIMKNIMQLSGIESIHVSAYKRAFHGLKVMKAKFQGDSIILASDLPFGLLYLWVISKFHIYLFYICLIVTILVVVLNILQYKIHQWKTISLNNKVSDKKERTIQFEEFFKIKSIIRSTGRINTIVEHYFTKHIQAMNEISLYDYLNIGIGRSINLIRQIGQVLITAISAYCIINEQMTSGAMIAASIISGKATAILNGISKIIIDLYDYNKASIEVHNIIFANERMLSDENKIIIQEFETLKLEGVSIVSNLNKKTILEGINYQINKGDFIQIKGKNGSGKSLLMKTMIGTYQEVAGKVLINDIYIQNISQKSFSKIFSYVDENCILFEGTILENIILLDSAIKHEQIVKIAQILDIHNYIQNLPQNYNYFIEDLSIIPISIRYKLQLIRAFYQNTAILVIDDIFRYFDEFSIQKIMKFLLLLKQNGKTIILVSNLTLSEEFNARVLQLSAEINQKIEEKKE